MKRFTAYRRNISERGTHTDLQRNPDDQPQYEGVIFTDGAVTIRWRTACRSTSFFSSLQNMLDVHGHPEYGTEFDWHDGEEPHEWTNIMALYKQKL